MTSATSSLIIGSLIKLIFFQTSYCKDVKLREVYIVVNVLGKIVEQILHL